MAWVDKTLLEIRGLITEDWKIEDSERMDYVRSRYVEARLNHANDTWECPYSDDLVNRVNAEFNNMLTAARIAESADMLRDQVTSALFKAPPGMESVRTASKVQGLDQPHLTRLRHTDAPV